MSANALYQRVEALSVEILQQTEEKNFEKVNELINVRLSVLKQLAEQELEKNDDDAKQHLREFLLACQAQDIEQLTHLAKERVKLLADGQQQSKVKQAVNTYQKFSG